MCNFHSCYECIQTYHLGYCWRRKWYFVMGFVLGVSIMLLLLRESTYNPDISQNSIEQNINMDGELRNVYKEVTNRWYNITDDDKWYNSRIFSISDSKSWKPYMTEIRQNWILWKHNSNKPYNLEHPEIEDPSMGQASVIRKIFQDKKNGFFVECGAYDGETRSNTLVLERFLDWTGLLVEADSINFSKMMLKNRKSYLSPVCLGLQPYPTVNTFLMADNVGRLHDPNADSRMRNSNDVAYSGVHIKVQCFPFAHLMAALNVTTVNYFSLDIEGHELEVLKTIPFDEINIETLSVEFAHVASGKKKLIDFMESKGYYVHSFVVRSDRLANDIIFTKYNYDSFNSTRN
ncbi:uncharacterized protein LOC114882758 isoform X1 [Osmia bicornis bicornis]|uniref:uncharacterized protein LOC114882758 isoform X1 n=2 Tax=Osmia bicornis bicornis TaxID=1437191 RepID=UPI0010F46808|nr:uncharacterized protein LOC114882758 isoform X1 [Osmia bicornis bicornis]